jgi:hypothetical protein
MAIDPRLIARGDPEVAASKTTIAKTAIAHSAWAAAEAASIARTAHSGRRASSAVTTAMLRQHSRWNHCRTRECTQDKLANHRPNLLQNLAKMPFAKRSASAVVR